MQRRAAAIYVALFLVIGAGSYSLIATAHTPTINFEEPDNTYEQNDTFQVEGQTYTVSDITAEVESGGGGHGGGGGGLVRSGQVSWVNDSARYTETWDNNTTVTVDGSEYRVLVEQSSGNPSAFDLQTTVNQTAILQDDPNADNETVTRDGEQYVVVEDENGDTTLVPADEYFPEPTSERYSEGDSLQYNGNQSTVAAVENESVELTWTASKSNTAELSNEGNVTLGGETYLAYFPNNESVVLTQDFESYNAQTEEIEEFHLHENGLWGVTILSASIIVLLTGLAFLPSRY